VGIIDTNIGHSDKDKYVDQSASSEVVDSGVSKDVKSDNTINELLTTFCDAHRTCVGFPDMTVDLKKFGEKFMNIESQLEFPVFRGLIEHIVKTNNESVYIKQADRIIKEYCSSTINDFDQLSDETIKTLSLDILLKHFKNIVDSLLEVTISESVLKKVANHLGKIIAIKLTEVYGQNTKSKNIKIAQTFVKDFYNYILTNGSILENDTYFHLNELVITSAILRAEINTRVGYVVKSSEFVQKFEALMLESDDGFIEDEIIKIGEIHLDDDSIFNPSAAYSELNTSGEGDDNDYEFDASGEGDDDEFDASGEGDDDDEFASNIGEDPLYSGNAMSSIFEDEPAVELFETSLPDTSIPINQDEIHVTSIDIARTSSAYRYFLAQGRDSSNSTKKTATTRLQNKTRDIIFPENIVSEYGSAQKPKIEDIRIAPKEATDISYFFDHNGALCCHLSDRFTQETQNITNLSPNLFTEVATSSGDTAKYYSIDSTILYGESYPDKKSAVIPYYEFITQIHKHIQKASYSFIAQNAQAFEWHTVYLPLPGDIAIISINNGEISYSYLSEQKDAYENPLNNSSQQEG